MDLALLSTLNRHRAAREAVALVTDLASGAARLVTPESLAGDPAAEAVAEAFRTGKSSTATAGDGDVFVDVHVPPVRLIVIGAVHISQALAEMARLVELDCTLIDPREAFATPERFPNVRLIAEWPDVALPPLRPDRYTAFVALTHDPKIDDPALTIALKAGCFYIGALGSRKTHARRLERLAAAGFSEGELARIRAPIGLDIGAVSPAEIAVSILAEIIGTQRQRRRG
ncbi:MAG: XdhC family protein [Beijerinckiaceae bacterium]|nr:XdhC family protein [Beijerinckiaceae bacterium]MCZ8301906.1 XdhC family protein [Beijerinckiaceae bacterium]